MRKLRKVKATTAADAVGAALVAVGVGAYSWPAGLIVGGVAVLAASWAAAGRSGAQAVQEPQL